MSLDVVTLGCRLNAFESELIRQQAARAGLADAVIVNTCAVTAEAVRRSGQAVRRARRERPGARLIVTGCAAQLEPERFAAMAEVDRVLGNAEKLEAINFRPDDEARVRVNDIMEAADVAGHLIEGFDGRARAFVQVQQGCDHRCTFCIIPFARGPSRSVPLAAVVEQASALVARGYNEIVLTGVDMTSYGADLAGRPRLGRMARRLLAAVPGLARLRLSSIDPAALDDDLLRLVAEEPRLMPHLHLSLQAGDDLILKRMKRRHGRDQALALCRRLRALRPDIALGADLIAGFPTEDEAAFRRTLDFIDEAGLAHLHVFAYSERAGTPAARMPAVNKAIRRERAGRLRAAGRVARARHLDARVGTMAQLVMETPTTGRSEHFDLVDLPPGKTRGETSEQRPGALARVRLLASDGERLLGVPAA